MADTRIATADLSTLDRVALQSYIAAQQQEMLAKDEALSAQREKLLSREIEQLERKLEELETQQAERVTAAITANTPAKAKPIRRPLPEHLPREMHTHLPAKDACPDCGGELRKLGEDVSEILERVPATYKVIRHVRVKMACSKCDVIVQAPAPSRPIERGLAGPNLLAHVLGSRPAQVL